MKKANYILSLSCCMLLMLSACSANPTSEAAALDTLAVESELTITASDAQVSDFVARNTDFISDYASDECYNITPDFIAGNSDYAIFKYGSSTQSFLLYEGEVYDIGTCFGGYGITSMALADLDQNSAYELYYTFSWGSGAHRSQVGYFDPDGKEIHVFDYALFDSDLILTVNQSGELCVNKAAFEEESWIDFVNFKLIAQDLIGR